MSPFYVIGQFHVLFILYIANQITHGLPSPGWHVILRDLPSLAQIFFSFPSSLLFFDCLKAVIQCATA